MCHESDIEKHGELTVDENRTWPLNGFIMALVVGRFSPELQFLCIRLQIDAPSRWPRLVRPT